METEETLLKYDQLDSSKLAAVLNENGHVDVLLSKRQAELIIKVIDVVRKINQASVFENTTLKKIDIYKAMLLNFWIMIFNSKLIEIVTFFTLEKPNYTLENQEVNNWLIRFKR